MSHLPEREAKNCLNCNARIYGRYCHICGQENLEPGESLWHLITHFFNDITHFDGKFFSTLKLLITKPGFLSGEYKRGRRASYLNPVRMYIFTSFTFFLIFFSVFDVEKSMETSTDGFTTEQVLKMDDSSFSAFTANINKGIPMTREEYKVFADTSDIAIIGDNYRDKKEYDSLKAVGAINPNWIMDRINYQGIKIKEKYKGDNKKALSATLNIFAHNFPQILFLSLPLFAFFLWLIYFKRKDMYFVAHGIFAVHVYIFYFIALLVLMAFSWLNQKVDLPAEGLLVTLFFIILFYYEYKAMRYFYQQRRAKTIFKFLLVLTWRLIVFLFLFLAFLIFSFLKI